MNDPAIQRQLQQTQAAAQMQAIIHDLTDKCWETCMDKPGPKLDSKQQSCLNNCVQRFIDANILATRQLENKASSLLKQHDELSLE